MKPSNLQTPRTQADAILLPSFDPIERLQRRNVVADTVVIVASTVAAVACAVIIIVWG